METQIATLDECRQWFRDIVEIFPGSTLQSIEIKQGESQMAFFNFTKDEIKEQSFELLPAGKYTAMVCDHEWKDTKSGHMLALTFEVTGPTLAGRKLFENYNIDNPSDQAVQIAMAGIKALCLSADAEEYLDAMFAAPDLDGFVALLDHMPEALYNRNVEITVGVEKSKDPQYGDKNKVKGYAAVKEVVPVKPAGRGAAPGWSKK